MQSQREKSIRYLRRVLTVGAAAVLLFVLAVVVRMGREHVPSVKSPPVILISVASLDAEEAYSRKSMPNMMALAVRSLVFKRASTCIPDPLASVASLLTGCYPEAHQLGLQVGAKLNPKVPTLAEMFKHRGYATAAFVGDDVLSPATEIQRGFDRFDVFGPSFTNSERGLGSYGRTALETVYEGLSWLDQHPGQPCFLFLQLNDLAANQPIAKDAVSPALKKYLAQLQTALPKGVPPSRGALRDALAKTGLSTADLNALRALYRSGITSTDQAMKALFNGLQKRGMFESATIVLAGDRGEPLARRSTHSDQSLYQDCVTIPLMMKLVTGRRTTGLTTALAQNVDVAPTLIELLGLEPENPPQGLSLSALTRQQESPRTTAYYVAPLGQRAFRQGAHKLLVDGRRMRLFDLSIDPEERQDLIANPLHPKLFPKAWAASQDEVSLFKRDMLIKVNNLKNLLQLEMVKFTRSIVPKVAAAPAGNMERVAAAGE